MARRLIGFITATPESIYATRIIKGICERCAVYDYDVAIIGTLADISLSQKNYLAGEINIYNLINFALLDGVIVDTLSLMDSTTRDLIPEIPRLLKEKCNKPIVCLGPLLQDYPSFITCNRQLLAEITGHLIDVHNCRDVYCLTGPKGDPDAIDRLNGFIDALAARSIPCDESRIFYGDFWYPGGKALARKIISGEVPMPQAVVCASDHMAIGLTNQLIQHGIRVPEDVIVTGFDATPESIINQVTISSATPDSEGVAAHAVDALRRMMDPQAEPAPFSLRPGEHLSLGMSCGCNHDVPNIMARMRESVYNVSHDFSDGDTAVDIGLLLESNMTEYLSDTANPRECLEQVFLKTYLLRPYKDFYLCLDENWLNAEQCTRVGYPPQIQMVVHTTPELGSGHWENGPVFETSLMLPELHNTAREASVFYFMPVHFLDQSMGYAALRYALNEPHKMTCIVRNWLKNVNSGLHISRTAHRLESLSTRDGMTGAYNRRGMELMLDHMLSQAAPNASILALVIDMDRLKYINDSFGHADGDAGINAICSAAMSITGEGELCVRAGGDEFYVIGVGQYTPSDIEDRLTCFHQAIEQINAAMRKPYALSASIGSACIPLSSGMTVMGAIRIADAKMYENKVQKKLQRED